LYVSMHLLTSLLTRIEIQANVSIFGETAMRFKALFPSNT